MNRNERDSAGIALDRQNQHKEQVESFRPQKGKIDNIFRIDTMQSYYNMRSRCMQHTVHHIL